MPPVIYQTYHAYKFGSSQRLLDMQLEKMAGCFSISTSAMDGGLEGRTSVKHIHLDGIGPVVIKHYMRGGLVGKFNKRLYLNLGKPRPGIEYGQLLNAREAGISAPEPVCFAFRGSVLYTGWLVTREIEHPQSLARLSMTDTESAVSAIEKLIPQISLLLDNRIYHKDLHPGNVLVDDKSGRIFIIDFDKAGFFRGDRQALLNIYLKRWARAVQKYNLPKEIYSMLRQEL